MTEMDDNERVKYLVHHKISEILTAQADLTTEAQDSLLADYMKVFSKNWTAVLQAYAAQLPEVKELDQNHVQKTDETATPCINEGSTSDESSPAKLDEELEEAAVTYEAALIATTKQRSAAPAKVAKLLGSSTRFASLMLKEVCVDLPHRPLLENTTLKKILDPDGNTSTAFDNMQSRMEKCNSTVSEMALSIQSETERLDNIATALEIVSSNAKHSTHKLLSKIS